MNGALRLARARGTRARASTYSALLWVVRLKAYTRVVGKSLGGVALPRPFEAPEGCERGDGASMEPRSCDRGTARTTFVCGCTMLLQWGRGPKTAAMA